MPAASLSPVTQHNVDAAFRTNRPLSFLPLPTTNLAAYRVIAAHSAKRGSRGRWQQRGGKDRAAASEEQKIEEQAERVRVC